MPDISKYEDIIQDLENGTYPYLGLTISSQNVTPGTKIAKKDTGESPVLSAPSTLPEEDTYTVISLDIDAPFRPWNVLSPIAHWIQTDFKIQDQNQGRLESGESPVLPWLPAGPPPGAAPHRYIFMLYKQRPDKSVPAELKKKGARVIRPQRMRYDVDKIVKTLGLGEIVAVTYFVSN